MRGLKYHKVSEVINNIVYGEYSFTLFAITEHFKWRSYFALKDIRLYDSPYDKVCCFDLNMWYVYHYDYRNFTDDYQYNVISTIVDNLILPYLRYVGFDNAKIMYCSNPTEDTKHYTELSDYFTFKPNIYNIEKIRGF